MSNITLTRPATSSCVVIGGGTMGADIAFLLLRAGVRHVTVVEPRAQAHAQLWSRMETDSGHIAVHSAKPLTERFATVSSLSEADTSDVDLVIECAPEVLSLKQAVFRELVERMPGTAVLASNSSSFPISEIAHGLKTRERMYGLHFFMPAHVVPLVEVVLAADSDADGAQALAVFMRRCGSVPILVRKDVAGFIANRLQHALAREAYTLIQEGVATPEDIDAAVRFGFGFRYLAAGPLLQKDHGGIDVHAAAAATIYPTLSNVSAPPAVLADKAAAGRHGMKSGAGFYEWDTASVASERERYVRVLQEGLRALAAELPQIDP